MNKDQASLLREKFSHAERDKTEKKKTRVRALSFTSGKGGVGKTSIVTNLAIQFARMGKKVFLIDADLGLANIDIMLNLTPKFTIEDVLKGKKHIRDVILKGPEGIDILPAASGVSEMSELNAEQQMSMLNELGGLKTQYDYILIDTGAGIASSVLRFNAAADEICVITNTEPTAMTDAYALMKIMTIKYQIKRFNLIVNQSKYPEAKDVYDRLSHVFDRFLPAKLILTGFIPRDPHFSAAIKQQKPLTLISPDSVTTKAFKLVAEHLEQKPGQSFPEGTQDRFWERLKNWKKVF
jgi:flagellar biosynthesis protein FlhG